MADLITVTCYVAVVLGIFGLLAYQRGRADGYKAAREAQRAELKRQLFGND